MEKDTHLVNIYLKIHHKRPLTMDDLRYLAEYAPECFEKTCKNVVYNRPEAKPLMEPKPQENSLNLWGRDNSVTTVPPSESVSLSAADLLLQTHALTAQTNSSEAATDTSAPNTGSNNSTATEQEAISAVLENLSQLEADSFPISNLEADEVKNLLGNLYMEMLFPHNDTHSFFQMTLEPASSFDRKA